MCIVVVCMYLSVVLWCVAVVGFGVCCGWLRLVVFVCGVGCWPN